MAYKFPWTNYHELNLDWILDTVKKLFAQTEQNNAIVEQYDGRLTEVELTADNAQTAAEQAQQNSTAALDLAQGAQTAATQAQQAAAQAQQAAGQAQTAAGQALEAAATAQQTATQAQQTAQNFDGRIRQAEDNAASALQAAQAFDEQVQGAITAANNANEAATAALTTSAETARELEAQRDTLEDIIENAAQSLEIDLSTKADIIINTAEGEIASFNDGADDMPIKKLVVNIEPAQAGTGDPSPDNVRPISGHTGAKILRTGKNLYNANALTKLSIAGITATVSDGVISLNGTSTTTAYFTVPNTNLPSGNYVFSFNNPAVSNNVHVLFRDTNNQYFSDTRADAVNKSVEIANQPTSIILYVNSGTTLTDFIIKPQLELGSVSTSFEEYQVNQISVNWETEAGTVYGGTLTINPDRTGELVVDRICHTYKGGTDSVISSRSYDTNNRCMSIRAGSYPHAITDNGTGSLNINKPMCDKLPSVTFYSISSVTQGFASQGNWAPAVALKVQGCSTGAEYDAWCLANEPQISWILATPITYQLTESEISGILETLYGQNNIWSDAGSVDVEYSADTKTYIDNKFAELQALILEH